MNTLKTTLIGFLSGAAGATAVFLYAFFTAPEATDGEQYYTTAYEGDGTSNALSSAPLRISDSPLSTDFSYAASTAIPSVVYINGISHRGTSYSYWDLLFNNSPHQQVSSGSGVILDADGYIVTNNHVVESAEKIQVIYNKKAYPAILVGTDPSTDLAVLKIEKTQLPPIALGSSKELLIGEWVIAVGNPFSLSSTVTAGIVSAKGRRINVVEDKFPIESFIQTDAAINPGNSGGALVNKKGELVGINTAILSRTGSYTGYSFAVPIDIAKKVFADIVRYGLVQKPFFGAQVEEYNFQNVKKYNLNTKANNFSGVLITALERAGAAEKAGLELGDIIIKFEDASTDSKSEFEEALSYHSPGDRIKITYVRGNREGVAMVTLVNKDGRPDLIKRKLFTNSTLGATFEATDYGVKVSRIKDGLFEKIGFPENYTIVSINRNRVKDPEKVIKFFTSYKGAVFLYGITNNRKKQPISFYLQ